MDSLERVVKKVTRLWYNGITLGCQSRDASSILARRFLYCERYFKMAVLDSYEVIHHLISAIKIVRPQLNGDGRYIIDAATRIAEEWAQEDGPVSDVVE